MSGKFLGTSLMGIGTFLVEGFKDADRRGFVK